MIIMKHWFIEATSILVNEAEGLTVTHIQNRICKLRHQPDNMLFSQY